MTEVREREEFARTKQYQKSAIPACQRLVNNHFWERSTASGPAGVGAGEGAKARTGSGEEAGDREGEAEGEGARPAAKAVQKD